MVGGHDHLVPRRAPGGQEGGEGRIHRVAGEIHLAAVLSEAMRHGIQRAGMQQAIVQAEAGDQVRQCGEQVHVTGGHLVVAAFAGHGVQPTMLDRQTVIIELDIPHRVEGIAVEHARPVGVGDRAGHAACP